MKLNKYITGYLLCLLVLGSCNKAWLEKKANINQSIPNSLRDFQGLLDHIEIMNSNVFAYGEIAADGHYVTENAWSAALVAAQNAYTWEHKPYVNQANWGATYLRVFHCNLVLDGLSRMKPSASEKKFWEDIKGQALFMRALTFWELAQVFAEPYNAATAASDAGIPMKFTIDIVEPSVRYSVQETYDQILKDINEAIDLLPEKAINATRGSKAAAYSLLARYYLDKEDYENALINAEKCLAIQSALIDYSTLSTGSSTLIGSSSNFNTPLDNPEIIFFDRLYTSGLSNFVTSAYLVDRSLYDQYETGDYRRARFFRTISGGHLTFKGNYNSAASAIFCGIATDEIYLIKAECLARKGNFTEAISILNTLLETRYDNSFVPHVATSAEEALTLILKERRKELILRNLRWTDLRRLNRDDRFKITITRTIGGNSYELAPNSHKYTFAIPDDVIAISKMPQTPGW